MSCRDQTLISQDQIQLADLIAPMSVDEFRRDYWLKQPCYIKGAPDKFSRLFSWVELASILEDCHCDYPRIRMSKYGVELAAKNYLQTLPFTRETRIHAEGFYEHFNSGATLIFQHVDEFSFPLREVATALERGLGWPAEVEVIAGKGTPNGLPVHFDANECFAMQIEGVKKWRFYEPTRVHPLKKSKLFPRRVDMTLPTPPATEVPALDVEVHPGGFVYIPRGWWHIVEPQPGPCLSLNPTVYCAAMQDLIHWLSDELSDIEVFRDYLPLQEMGQREVLSKVMSELAKQLTPEAITKYYRYFQGDLERERRITLPVDGTANQCVISNMSLRVASKVPLFYVLDRSSGQFRIRWKGKTLFFRKEHYKLFEKLNDCRPHGVEELLLDLPFSEDARSRAVKFLTDLKDNRILEFHCPPPPEVEEITQELTSDEAI